MFLSRDIKGNAISEEKDIIFLWPEFLWMLEKHEELYFGHKTFKNCGGLFILQKKFMHWCWKPLTHYRELVKSGMSLIFVKYSAGIKMNVTMKVTEKTHLFL